MARLTLLTTYLACLLWSLPTLGQGPNTLAPYNPNLRTFSANGTWFIIPISTSKVQQAVPRYPLGPVPRSDKSIFPKGFPANKHPVIVMTAYENDIRNGNLEINALMAARVIVPYVDRLGDGTPFAYPVDTYIGGANGQSLMGVVPVVVGSLTSAPIKIAQITPDNAAYLRIGPDEFISQVKKVTIPNPVSGPQVAPAAIDLDFFTASRPKYSAHTFQTLLNQPQILTSTFTKCQRNPTFFNATFANPILRTGNIILYAPTIPASLVGVYKSQTGFSANGETVGYSAQDCRAAANAMH